MLRRPPRLAVYEDITKTIGNTPVVKISDKMCPEGVEVYAKCEYFNPLSSVKDRLALAIIQDAEGKNACEFKRRGGIYVATMKLKRPTSGKGLLGKIASTEPFQRPER